MDSDSGVLLRAVELHEVQVLVFDQVRRLAGLAAEADEDVGGDVRVLGEAGERAVELLVVRRRRTACAQPCLVGDRRRRRRRSGSSSSRPGARTRSAMYLLVLAEQFTVLMMAM